MHTAAILSVCLLLGLHPLRGQGADTAGQLTPEQVQRLVREKGPAIMQDKALQDNWNPILRAVAAGNEQWLDVATELLRYSDGESSGSLSAALGEALAHSPREVLRRLDGKYATAQSVCGNTFGDAGWLGVSWKTSAPTLRAQKKALGALQDPDLSSLRETCLALVKRQLEAQTK
jgi:hypothetical protein